MMLCRTHVIGSDAQTALLGEVLWEKRANPDPTKYVYMSVRINLCPFYGGGSNVVLIKRWCHVTAFVTKASVNPTGSLGEGWPLRVVLI